MKKLIVCIILLGSVSLNAQTMMKKEVTGKTYESCEASNVILANKVEELGKSLSVVKIDLKKCLIFKPVWDDSDPTSYVQSAEIEYQVKSILGNY